MTTPQYERILQKPVLSSQQRVSCPVCRLEWIYPNSRDLDGPLKSSREYFMKIQQELYDRAARCCATYRCKDCGKTFTAKQYHYGGRCACGAADSRWQQLPMVSDPGHGVLIEDHYFSSLDEFIEWVWDRAVSDDEEPDPAYWCPEWAQQEVLPQLDIWAHLTEAHSWGDGDAEPDSPAALDEVQKAYDALVGTGINWYTGSGTRPSDDVLKQAIEDARQYYTDA